ncbi:MAG: hypothetical protein WA539_03480, partial [Candidatus Sulfotelmatobacter sp.]
TIRSGLGHRLGHREVTRFCLRGTAKPSIIQTTRNYNGGTEQPWLPVAEFGYFGVDFEGVSPAKPDSATSALRPARESATTPRNPQPDPVTSITV